MREEPLSELTGWNKKGTIFCFSARPGAQRAFNGNPDRTRTKKETWRLWRNEFTPDYQ
jgi:hypothetical protein